MDQSELKIISGGQTGVDRIALEEARALNIATGGSTLKNFMTELGSDPSLATFGLEAMDTHSYPVRTEKNVHDAGFTFIFTHGDDELTRGGKCTRNKCIQLGKPFIVDPDISEIVSRLLQFRTVNIAGPRGSTLDRVRAEEIRATLRSGFREAQNIVRSLKGR